MQIALYPHIVITPELRSLCSCACADEALLLASINNNDSNSNSGWGRFAVSD